MADLLPHHAAQMVYGKGNCQKTNPETLHQKTHFVNFFDDFYKKRRPTENAC